MNATIVFLTRNDFFNRTGFNPANVVFCVDRKGGVCEGFRTFNNQLRGLDDEDLKYFGLPRVSTTKCGKGAVGRKLGMSCTVLGFLEWTLYIKMLSRSEG